MRVFLCEESQRGTAGQAIDCLQCDYQSLENDALMNRKPMELLKY